MKNINEIEVVRLSRPACYVDAIKFLDIKTWWLNNSAPINYLHRR